MQTVEPTGDSNPRASSSTSTTSRAMQMLEEGIATITDTESFKSYLAFTKAFHSYSANNVLLIFLQRPDATMVAGYKKWRQLGRQVRKGETAIKILAPIVRDEVDDESGQEIRRVVGFRDANVFALEQTDSINGDPLPAPPMTGRVSGGEEAAGALYDLLSGICAAEGVEVSERELGPGHYGYHDPMRGSIVLSDKLSTLRKATTLCHELCHYFLHPLRTSLALDTATKETEAEGASFAICSHFGIDTQAFSFPYVARHAEDPKTLSEVLSRIQAVVHKVLEQAQAIEEAEEAEEVEEGGAADVGLVA